jgi:hypothetical protein
MCLKCCAAKSEYCRVSTHRQAKIQTHQGGVADFIQEALQKSHTVWFVYNGGSTPGRPRAVQPQSWVMKNVSFMGKDATEQAKKYYVDKLGAYSTQ